MPNSPTRWRLTFLNVASSYFFMFFLPLPNLHVYRKIASAYFPNSSQPERVALYVLLGGAA